MGIPLMNNEQGNEGNTMDETPLQIMPQVVSKETIADWKDSAAEYVRSEMFDKKQFVTDQELVVGGNLQRLVCYQINISGNERARKFWNDNGGRETVRMTVCRKRQAAQNAMKIAFKGKS